MSKDTWFKEYDQKFWKPVRNGIARLDRSTGFGLYPFTVEGITVTKKVNWDAKTGCKTVIYINKETDVQVMYLYSRVRYYDMSNPVESKEYWNGRAKVKAQFVKTFYGRK